MNLENILLSQRSESQKSHMVLFTWVVHRANSIETESQTVVALGWGSYSKSVDDLLMDTTFFFSGDDKNVLKSKWKLTLRKH